MTVDIVLPLQAASFAPPILRHHHVFGLDFVDSATLAPVVEVLLDGRINDGPGAGDTSSRLPVVVTPNVDHLVHLDRDTEPRATRIIRAAALVLPDGQPVVWASRWLGRPLGARLPGSELVAALFPELVAQRRRVVVVAASEEVARRVEAESPRAKAVVAPMLQVDDPDGIDAFCESCAATIAGHDAEFVFVSLSFPKPYLVIDGLLRRLGTGAPLFLAVGASFEMRYGLVRRAPAWVQRIGMEWCFRFLQEPRRLFRRYFVDDPAFARIVWRELRRRRSDHGVAR
jgi:N-acetylglucosaminyldiphosphoundecaprenol N-acetyl-beta-D-mannosaminyltransferase